MLFHLIRKEILDHILSLRFLILTIVGALTIWLSLFSGYEVYQNNVKDYRLTQAMLEGHIRYLSGVGVPSRTLDIGYPVQKPPLPLSIFVKGLEPTLGRIGYTGYKDTRRLKFSPVAEEPLLGIFPPIGLEAVVQIVLSLFVLLLTYDAVCGEKERGTLRLTASFPIPKAHLLLSKLLGTLILNLIAFLPPLLLGLAVVFALPDVQFQNKELIRLGLILFTFELYLTAFTCIGILGSCLSHRAATSFVMLFFFWVVVVVVLPRLSLIVADISRPAPSTQQLQAELGHVISVHNQNRWNAVSKWGDEYRANTGKSWWQVPAAGEARAMLRKDLWAKMQKNLRTDSNRLKQAFRNRYNARFHLATNLARFSPAFALNNAVVSLTGTGQERHQRFLDTFNLTRDHIEDWYPTEKLQQELAWADAQKHGEYDRNISDMPRLMYQDRWPDDDVRAALMDVGVLALWNLLSLTAAYVALLKYDLR